jgi:hypothetical protein
MVHSLFLLADHVANEPEWQECKPSMLTFRFPRSDHRPLCDGFHCGMASSLRCGVGLFGVPFTILLKACCWAVWPTPTILLLRIDKDSCGTVQRIWIGRTTLIRLYGARGWSER